MVELINRTISANVDYDKPDLFWSHQLVCQYSIVKI